MLIISKKALKFEVRKDGEVTQSAEVRPNIITSIPEWVTKTKLFAFAKKEGCITFVNQAVSVAGSGSQSDNGEDGKTPKSPKNGGKGKGNKDKNNKPPDNGGKSETDYTDDDAATIEGGGDLNGNNGEDGTPDENDAANNSENGDSGDKDPAATGAEK